MAGSYNHCVDDQGRLLAPDRLCSMLECMSGDVYEAAEEMYGMIWYLAAQMAQEPGVQDTSDPAALVEEARQNYEQGLDLSPGLRGERTSAVVRRQLRNLRE